jgi:hypothetical protein
VLQVLDRFLEGEYECGGLALGLSRIESAREGFDCQADVPLIEHLTRALPAAGVPKLGPEAGTATRDSPAERLFEVPSGKKCPSGVRAKGFLPRSHESRPVPLVGATPEGQAALYGIESNVLCGLWGLPGGITRSGANPEPPATRPRKKRPATAYEPVFR